MSSFGKQLAKFGKESQRRRVGKVVVAYLAASWLLIEVSSEVFPALLLPDWAARFVIIGAIAGLPVVFAIAWIFDWTPHGVVRTGNLPKRKRPKGRKVAHIVGREHNLQTLDELFSTSRSGNGQFVGVAGEAGMGKSTLVETFLQRASEDGSECLIGCGYSSERHGETSAYMPVIEVLSELVGADASGSLAYDLGKFAPTWHSLVIHSDSDEVQRANSQTRLLHELGAFLSHACIERPIIISFEDFHWADVSTLDTIVFLADRLQDLKLLLIVTYRESELLQTEHPFVSAMLSLKSRGAFREIRLQLWGADQVGEVIDAEFSQNIFPSEFVLRVFERTNGNPLFVIDLMRYLQASEILVCEAGEWQLRDSVEKVTESLPDTVRSMVERKASKLSEIERKYMAAASVQGFLFDSVIISKVLEISVADFEEYLEKLERVHNLVFFVEEIELPDGLLSCRYKFSHILYHEHFFSNLRPNRKVEWAKSTAEAIEDCYQNQTIGMESQLAHLYGAARDYEKSAVHYLEAAAGATLVFAHREAAAMAKSGLYVLDSAPESKFRDAQEILLQLALGRSLCLTQGYASSETMACFARALEITEETAENEQSVDLVWSLWMAYANTGNCKVSMELANRLSSIAAKTTDPLDSAAANVAIGISNEISGNLPIAKEHFQVAIEFQSSGTSSERANRFVVDPLIMSQGNQLRLLALMGFADASEKRWEQNLALINSGSLDPRSSADLLIEGAWYHGFYNRFEKVIELTEQTVSICNQYDIFMEYQWAMFQQSWANTVLGDVEKGLSGMKNFLVMIEGSGAFMHASLYYATLGEALAKNGYLEEARDLLNQGLKVLEETGQGYFAPEVYRVRGEVAAELDTEEQAIAWTQKAYKLAIEHDARLLEYRAALSMSKLLGNAKASVDGIQILNETAVRMHEGFNIEQIRSSVVLLEKSA